MTMKPYFMRIAQLNSGQTRELYANEQLQERDCTTLGPAHSG